MTNINVIIFNIYLILLSANKADNSCFIFRILMKQKKKYILTVKESYIIYNHKIDDIKKFVDENKNLDEEFRFLSNSFILWFKENINLIKPSKQIYTKEIINEFITNTEIPDNFKDKLMILLENDIYKNNQEVLDNLKDLYGLKYL